MKMMNTWSHLKPNWSKKGAIWLGTTTWPCLKCKNIPRPLRWDNHCSYLDPKLSMMGIWCPNMYVKSLSPCLLQCLLMETKWFSNIPKKPWQNLKVSQKKFRTKVSLEIYNENAGKVKAILQGTEMIEMITSLFIYSFIYLFVYSFNYSNHLK